MCAAADTRRAPNGGAHGHRSRDIRIPPHRTPNYASVGDDAHIVPPARYAPPKSCHCEERSDVAIRFFPRIALPSPATRSFLHAKYWPPAAGTEKYCLFLVKKLTGLFVS